MLSVDEITGCTGGMVISPGDASGGMFSGIAIDSRTVKDGELFAALKGARHDAHDFLDEVFTKTGGALVERTPARAYSGRTVIKVADTLKAIQDVAGYCRRRKGNLPVAAITGTCGKTTTKEMTAKALGTTYQVLKTEGNYNNHIGLPLFLSRLDGQDAVVVEMGASAPGDIRLLCEIARPDIGMVTNIGPAHLEGFGSLEAVRNTKLELMDYADTMIVNRDDRFLMEGVKARQGRKKIVTFGLEGEGLVSGRMIKGESGQMGPRVAVTFSGGSTRELSLAVPGVFNVYNALAAAACAQVLGVDVDLILDALAGFHGMPMRMEVRLMGGAQVLFDVYNANPLSMREAVKELVRLKGRRAVAVTGDMLELGRFEEEEHRSLGSWMAQRGVDVLITVGPLMKLAADAFEETAGSGRTVHRAADVRQARELLRDLLSEDDTVLIKGSRGCKMEEIVDSTA